MQIKKIPLSLYILSTLIIAALIYYPGVHGPFIFDDGANIPKAIVKNLNWHSFLSALMQNTSGFIGRPLSQASFILTSYFFGEGAFGFKLVNIFLHLTNGILIFALAHKILPKNKTNTIAAFIAMTFWLLHPLQVSTVLYAVQRMTILSTLFCALGIYLYLIGRERLLQNKKYANLLLLLSVMPCALFATLSKENGLLLFLFILSIEAIIFRFNFANPAKKKDFYGYLVFFIALPITLGAIYLLINLNIFLGHYEYRDFTLYERLLTQSRVLFYYLRLIFFPRLSELSLYHDDFSLSNGFDITTTLAVSGIFGLIFLALLIRKKSPIISLGIIWFFVAHIMESSIFSLELVFEHRNYFALFGPALIISTICIYLWQNINKTAIKLSLCAIGLILLSLTVIRVQIWSNPVQLFANNLHNHPTSPRAHIDWANWLIFNDNWQEANKHLDYVASILPNNPGPDLHKLRRYCTNSSSNSIKPELIEDITRKLNNFKQIYYATNSLIIFTENFIKGECPNIGPDILIPFINAALENPSVKAHGLVKQQLYHEQAKLLFYTGEYEKALQQLTLSFKANPKDLKPLLQKALQQIVAGDLTGAKQTIKELQNANSAKIIDNSYQIAEIIKLLKAKELSQQQASSHD